MLKTFLSPVCFHSEDGVFWLWHPLGNLYVCLTISSCYSSIFLAWALIVRNVVLSTLCHSCGLAFQQSVLKAFPASGYLHSEDEIIWLWHPLVSFYVWLTIPSCYGSIPLGMGWRGRDGGFSILCHSCVLEFQQSVLKVFPGSSYLLSEDGVVWLCHPLVNLYICLTISSC